jgi:hypothetical protein
MAIVNENKLLRENSIKIVGKLTDAQVTTGNRKDNGAGYISVDATVVSVINGVSNEFKVNFYTSQLTKDGKQSKLYDSYSKLPEMVGRKVEIDGEIRENRYYSSNLNQLISTQLLAGKFVKGVVESAVDTATFVVGGFLVKTPVEKRNKKDEVYRYDVTLGQSNYAGNGMSMITLHINPAHADIVRGVEGLYNVGDTIQFTGSLVFKTEIVTVEDENTAFGAPVTKTYTNRQSNFYIEGGSNPLTDERAYSQEVVKTLIDAYKANDVKLQNASVEKAPVANTAPVNQSAPAVTKRQTSLI